MSQIRVQCPDCGKKAWCPEKGIMTHASCPKRGAGATKKAAPQYVPVEST